MNKNSNLENLLKILENISILELNEFLNILEKKYNLNNLNFFKNDDEDLEKDKSLVKKTNFSIYLSEIGINKISVIKIIKEVNNLTLKSSKELVDSYPVLIKENIDIKDCEDIKKKLEDVGAKVDIK